MKKVVILKQCNKNGAIVCDLNVGEHLKRIQGLDYFGTAYDYEVLGEYPHLYLIRIKYRKGLVSDNRNYICASISKSSIYCGSIVLTKEDGRRVEAYQDDPSGGRNA